MRENMPLLSRVVDPPGTKGGPRAGNFSGPPKNTFCPGWSHDPGQKARDKKCFQAGRENSKPVAHLQSRVDLPFGIKGACFSSFPPYLLFVFYSFYFSFKIGFHLLIQLKKLWFQKLQNKISYLYIDLIHATKMFNFH